MTVFSSLAGSVADSHSAPVVPFSLMRPPLGSPAVRLALDCRLRDPVPGATSGGFARASELVEGIGGDLDRSVRREPTYGERPICDAPVDGRLADSKTSGELRDRQKLALFGERVYS